VNACRLPANAAQKLPVPRSHALVAAGLNVCASIADHAPLKDLDGGMHTPVDTEVQLFSSNLAAHGECIGAHRELKRTLASQVTGLRCASVPCSFSNDDAPLWP